MCTHDEDPYRDYEVLVFKLQVRRLLNYDSQIQKDISLYKTPDRYRPCL